MEDETYPAGAAEPAASRSAYPVFNFNKRVSWLTSGTGYAGSRSGVGCAGKMDCVWLGFFPVFEFCYLEDAKTQRHREFRRGLG